MDSESARALLVRLGAPARLLRHVELVGEAAELLLAGLGRLGIAVDAELVRAGVVLHDAGKILHPAEMDAPGATHEPAGEALLRAHGVTPELARVCVSHARWAEMPVSFEELLIALADTLWKGVRKPKLEDAVVDRAAAAAARGRVREPSQGSRDNRWDVYITLDTLFEEIAAGGTARLERSRT